MPIDAHAVLGIEPAHGSFRGGQLALIRGNGFASTVRVWFGDVEVPAGSVTSTRSDRVQVTVPAGAPGTVAVTTQNGDDSSTRRALEGAYTYDSFFAEPSSGPTSGGNVITLVGSGTTWDMTTEVSIDGAPCELLALRDGAGEQELDCRVPPGTEGSKTISVNAAGDVTQLLGGFNYEPGAAAQGGLSGAPLDTELTVLVIGAGGRPIPGAYVILGDTVDVATAGAPASNVQITDSSGRVVFAGPFEAPPLVTAAARCFQPQSFAGVPVDTVTLSLSVVASPDCVDADPQIFGGSPVPPAVLSGELLWRSGAEFQRAGWTNVPTPPRDGERRAAYVLQPSGDAEARFRLPAERLAITRDSAGRLGYEFQVVTGGGNRTFYALAGVENRSVNPPRFTAYAMGVLSDIYVQPGESVEGLAIRMDLTLDQALTLNLTSPEPGARGPDRLDLRVAVELASGGFAILPNSQVEAPLAREALDLIGVPALVGDLTGARYVIGARAVSGAERALPQSVLPWLRARGTSTPVEVTGFLPVPALTVGSNDEIHWNRQLAATWTEAPRAVDLVLYEIQSGSGLITWSVAAPPNAATLSLPDLSQLPEGGLLSGELDIVVSLASVTDFVYSELQSSQLRRFSWDAYAVDAASSRYDPGAE